jgi:hypothetical protein
METPSELGVDAMDEPPCVGCDCIGAGTLVAAADGAVLSTVRGASKRFVITFATVSRVTWVALCCGNTTKGVHSEANSERVTATDSMHSTFK